MTSRELAKELYKIGKTTDAGELADSFISYIEKKNMTHLLPGVLKQLEILAKKDYQENALKITFAKKPTEETVSHVVKMIDVDMEPSVSIDNDILSGFIAEYNGKYIDASTKTYMRKLQQELISL